MKNYLIKATLHMPLECELFTDAEGEELDKQVKARFKDYLATIILDDLMMKVTVDSVEDGERVKMARPVAVGRGLRRVV